jgi:catechol 2,3-dioxygenase-like lactoylglutathione lyase family enzyme
MYGPRDFGVTLLAVITALPVAVSQQQTWPAAVSNAGITWDSASAKTLVYGGMRDRGEHRDSTLWAWDGLQWSALGDGAPGARSGLILASDPRHGRVLLYGGQNRSAQFDDTWEWRNGRWSRLTTAGPGPRHMTAGVFDPAHQQLVLFGGYSVQRQTMLGDTWTFDGSAWSQSAATGPPARAGHVVGFDPTKGRVILTGGADAQGRPFADSWSWDGSSWTRMSDGPAVTPNSQLVATPGQGMASFGGWDGSKPARALFEWNGTRWDSREFPGGPSARMETAIAYDAVRKKLVLFGGSDANGNKLNDLWEYDGQDWYPSRADASAPAVNTSGAFFAISVPELEASIRWYTGKLGLRVVLRPPRYENTEVAILEGNGLIVELAQKGGATPRPGASDAVQGFYKVGAVVDDLDGLVSLLRARGVEIVMGPFPAQPGQRANVIVRDNAGNLIQFFGR